MIDLDAYTFIQTKEGLDLFYEENKSSEWICIDTEFVGEKRFETLLCLIQIVVPSGMYIIDPFKITDLTPFLKLLTDPGIVKISHAGENDYRIFYNSYGILPKNVFDTQVAAGFTGYSYPISFLKLVERELDISLDKTHTVADWEARPLAPSQIAYALNDVFPLPDLWNRLRQKLVQLGRMDWLKEELSRFEKADTYIRNPVEDALANPVIRTVRQPKQVFLMRLYQWRQAEAKRKNHSLDMVLPSKWIAIIVKQIDSGKKGLLNNRILPKWIGEYYWDDFAKLYQAPPTPEELNYLRDARHITVVDPKQQLDAEMLYLLMKYKCFEAGIAPELVFNKSDLSYGNNEPIFKDSETNWRKQFLGENLVRWLNQKCELKLDFSKDHIVVSNLNA